MSTLEQAREAKDELARLLHGRASVIGLGVSHQGGSDYVVVARLAHADPDVPPTVRIVDPDSGEVDVTVRSEVVGTVRPED